jgi:hypothetical protein
MHNSGKGPYTVIGVAFKCGKLGENAALGRVVIYRQEYNHVEFPIGQLWARDMDEFTGTVMAQDGTTVPRFTPID